MQLVRSNERRIEDLECEIERLRQGKAPRVSGLRERLIVMVVNAVLLVAMAKLGVVSAEHAVNETLQKQETRVERDAWRNETGQMVEQALAEGCTFEENP